MELSEQFGGSSSNNISHIVEAKKQDTNLVDPEAEFAIKLGPKLQCKLCYKNSGKAKFPVGGHIATSTED